MRIAIRPLLPTLALCLTALAAPASARAQGAPAAPAPRDTAADRQAVLAVAQKLFDAMRAGDSTAARALFHAQAQLATAVVRQDGPAVMIEPIGEFMKAVGTPHAEVYDERTRNPIVHLDGPLAVVWMDYSFYVGSKFSHCGVDVFQMALTKEGWKILSIADTRRRQGCAQ